MESTSLLEQQRAIVAALRDLGPGWHSRADIAEKLGQNRLNIKQVALLDLLAEQGALQRQSMQPTPGSSAYVYRVK